MADPDMYDYHPNDARILNETIIYPTLMSKNITANTCVTIEARTSSINDNSKYTDNDVRAIKKHVSSIEFSDRICDHHPSYQTHPSSLPTH
jgi:hypothetical protein